MLTFGEILRERAWRAANSRWPNGPRVRAYTTNGVQCGLPGLGEGEERLTFPSHWTSQMMLNSGDWVRFATEAEMSDGSKDCEKWWRPLGRTVRTIVHSGAGGIVLPDDPVGMYGTTVTVLEQEPMDIPATKVPTPPNLDDIPTPRSYSSCSVVQKPRGAMDVESVDSAMSSTSSSAMEEGEEDANAPSAAMEKAEEVRLECTAVQGSPPATAAMSSVSSRGIADLHLNEQSREGAEEDSNGATQPYEIKASALDELDASACGEDTSI